MAFKFESDPAHVSAYRAIVKEAKRLDVVAKEIKASSAGVNPDLAGASKVRADADSTPSKISAAERAVEDAQRAVNAYAATPLPVDPAATKRADEENEKLFAKETARGMR